MTDSVVPLLSTIDLSAESVRTERLVLGDSGPPSVLFMLQQVLRNQLVILQLLERLRSVA